MRRPRHLGIGPRFLFVLARALWRACAPAHTHRHSLALRRFFSFHLLHLHRDRPSIFRRRVSGRALRYFAPRRAVAVTVDGVDHLRFPRAHPFLPRTFRFLSISAVNSRRVFRCFSRTERALVFRRNLAYSPNRFAQREGFPHSPATAITKTWREFYPRRKFPTGGGCAVSAVTTEGGSYPLNTNKMLAAEGSGSQ